MIPDLLDGLAMLLDVEGVATFRPDTAFEPGELPLVTGGLPEDPDRVMSISAPITSHSRSGPDSIIDVQIRSRSTDYEDVLGLSASVFAVLQARSDFVLPNGVRVLHAWHQGGGYLPPDAIGRHECSDTYKVQVDWLTTHRG